jgi:RimJ/RimL family protein N-acetyltransferase
LTDIPALMALYADPEIARYANCGETLTRAQVRDEIEKASRLWRERGYGSWAVEDRATGNLAGRIGYFPLSGWSWLMLAWMIAPEYRGRGLATEGSKAALDLAFNEWQVPLVVSAIRPANLASIKVAQKLGGNCVGNFRTDDEGWLMFHFEPASRNGTDGCGA